MTTQTEALKLAFKTHSNNERHRTLAETRYWCDQYKLLAKTAIEALSQPEQEPVAWMQDTTCGLYVIDHPDEWHCIPLYTTPPQRKPLTREQRIQIVKDNTVQGYHGDYFDAWGIIDDVEAAHGIKENK